jgi:hypothetical protein
MEMRRLTNVILPTENGGGYHYEMLDEVIRKGWIDEETVDDIEGAVSFFTLVLRAGSLEQQQGLLEGLTLLWPAEITSSTLTEYRPSSPTSTTGDATGPKLDQTAAPIETSQSSIPY